MNVRMGGHEAVSAHGLLALPVGGGCAGTANDRYQGGNVPQIEDGIGHDMSTA
jgi:hypothetical protein